MSTEELPPSWLATSGLGVFDVEDPLIDHRELLHWLAEKHRETAAHYLRADRAECLARTLSAHRHA